MLERTGYDVLQVCGVVISGMGVWVVTGNYSSILDANNPALYGFCAGIIVLGVVVMMISWCGCCGAWKENTCLLMTVRHDSMYTSKYYLGSVSVNAVVSLVSVRHYSGTHRASHTGTGHHAGLLDSKRKRMCDYRNLKFTTLQVWRFTRPPAIDRYKIENNLILDPQWKVSMDVWYGIEPVWSARSRERYWMVGSQASWGKG